MTAETFSRSSWSRIALLVLLMLLPWACTGIGLFVLRDYRITMLVYGMICCILPTLLFRQHAIRFLPVRTNPLALVGMLLGFNLLIWGSFQLTQYGIDNLLFQERAKGIHLLFNRQVIEYGLYFVIMNPLLEETFWRGFIYNEWRRFLPIWPSRLITSFFFGAWHWVIVQHFCPPLWAIVLAIAVMIGGLLFTLLYDKTGTLGTPVLVHGLGVDLPLLLIVLHLLRTSPY